MTNVKGMRVTRVIHRVVVSVCALALMFGANACEHDPTVLETHPLDLRGSKAASWDSHYLTMSDGIRIAVDVYVPLDWPGGGPFPTVLELTRYWRSRSSDIPYTIRRGLQRGFAWVVMDERGTGASFGEWSAPLTDRAVQDGIEVIDWIVDQEWSNGKVGATGVSYPGTSAHHLAAAGHPSLKAIVPMSDTYDQYEDLVFPGGVFNREFMEGWSDITAAMDRNASISVEGETFTLRPVDEDPTGELLAEAIAEHSNNLVAFDVFRDLTFRDDTDPQGLNLDSFSTHTRAQEIGQSDVAVYQWGSWLDGGSADGVIRAFMETSGPRRATIGSWTHDLNDNSFTGDGDRYAAVPPFDAQWEEVLNFFDDLLRKGKPAGERVIRYYTMGEGLWKATSTWPVPGTQHETLFLDEDGSLETNAPSGTEGFDIYEVDFEVRSAIEPRWLGPLFAHTWYPDRRSRDQDLLVYQTAPLSQDMEVTGYPVINLHLSSTHSDGAFFVYLEDVSPTGVVTYVTEGVLRGIHRKVGTDPSPWKRPIPYHSFLAADAQPIVPGEVFELSIGMEPTSFLFREGHRIRIAIAGHDSSAFDRIPAEGTPVLSIQRNSVHPSSLTLPVIRQPS
jgi:putative CocE/NonD family hydrolase